MANSAININFSLDIEAAKAAISEAKELNDNAEVFAKLSEIAKAKAKVKDLLEQVEAVEAEAKLEINAKAKSLYGPNWSAIAGEGYKVTRSKTGAVYNIGDPKKAEEYIKVEYKPDTDKIKDFLKSHSALPEGIDFNPDRNESITIKINADG